DRIQQQQRSKRLGGGAEFKERIAIDLLVGAVVQLPRSEDPDAVLIQKSDHHAGIAIGKMLMQERLDSIGVGIGKVFLGLQRIGRCKKTANHDQELASASHGSDSSKSLNTVHRFRYVATAS